MNELLSQKEPTVSSNSVRGLLLTRAPEQKFVITFLLHEFKVSKRHTMSGFQGEKEEEGGERSRSQAQRMF